MNTLTVTPDPLIAGGTARITHSGSGSIIVTITSDTGATQTISVPSGDSGRTWNVPAEGWQSATFTSPSIDNEIHRDIVASSAGAGN